MQRPSGNNADEWESFIWEHRNALSYLAVQVAEAIDQAEREACERAIDRMGWEEIKAFNKELHRGQSISEDAGGYLMRCIGRLFGVKPKDPVKTYQDAAKEMYDEYINKLS